MALFNKLGGMFTDNPVNRVGPTGQPLMGGSNITDLLTRSAGGLLGRDMRSPEEKILAAQQGIDTTTPQGAIEAAKARLQFETDPAVRAQISNQVIQMQRQIAGDAQREKIEQERLADIAKGEQRVNSIAKALTDLDDPETANLVLDGTVSPSEGSQYLGTLRRAAVVAADDLEGQKDLVNSLGYADSSRFKRLFEKDSKALNGELFKIYVKKEETERLKRENVDKASVVIDSSDVSDERKELAKRMLENDLLTLNGVGKFLTRGQTSTNFDLDGFINKDGLTVPTAIIDGKLSSWDGKEWVEGGSNNPLRPKQATGDKPIQRNSRTETSLKNVLEALKEESDDVLGPADFGFYGDFEELKGLNKLTFQSTAMDLAEARSKENRTTVQDEMRGAVEDMGKLIDNPIGRDATFSRPPNLNDFVNSAPVAPASSDNGKTTTITQEMLDNSKALRERGVKVGQTITIKSS
jgi:hypothetical protein